LHKHYDRILADDSLTDREVLLLTIYMIEYKNKKSGAKYSECKKLFGTLGRKEDSFRKRVHEAKKKSLVEVKNEVLHLLIGGIKKLRKIFGDVGKTPIYVIKSGENFKAIKLFEEFLSNEIQGNEILLCDPHISPYTLFPFSGLRGKITSMKILTSNIYDLEKFKGYKERMKKEMGINIEVRINRKIHDRYLISGNNCWHIGTSIKDLGNKDSIIKEIKEFFTSMNEIFLERWDESN